MLTAAMFGSDHESVLRRAQTGDSDAFSSLVSRYGPDVLRLCAVITMDPDLATVTSSPR